MKYIGKILGLVVSVLVSVAAPAQGQSWVATGSMSVERFVHTATLLTDGRVLVTGGLTSAGTVSPTAELYDPATGTWTVTGSMSVGRSGHTTTLLTDGRVLVAGGDTPAGTVTTAELYDPATGTWTVTGSMSFARLAHTATLLTDGRVLVTGGEPPVYMTPTAELFDPATGTWTVTGSMSYARGRHTATVLTDGRVLVAGGGAQWVPTTPTAELYDPATGTWIVTGSMSVERFAHSATLLTDGTVLVAGGGSGASSCADPPFCLAPVPIVTAEVFDPATRTWRLTGAMTDARVAHTATLLTNGRVLVAGGALGCVDGNVYVEAGSYPSGQLASAEEYDPVTGSWVARTLMQTGRYLHTATLPNDGRVLVAGGVSETITTVSIADDGWISRECNQILTTGAAELYDPTSLPMDPEPPDTSIVAAVDGNGASVPNDGVTLSNAITVAFAGTDNVAVAGFECRLDGASFAPCASPVTYSGLAVGRHGFEVRAVDTANNRDGTPALHTWTVDSPPETTITSAVDRQGNPIPNGGTTRSNQITFSFTGTDNGSVTGFECSLDGAAFTACTSPITYRGLSKGQHTFQVRAIDNNGFRDPTPAVFTWTRS